MPIPLIPTLVRLIVPLSIFRWPLIGILLSTLCDMYDWKFVKVATPDEVKVYQTWDKAMDLYFQTIIVIVVLRFKDELFKKTTIFLYVVRVVGDVLFFSTYNRGFLLFFPNVFENFVIFYLLYRWLSKKEILFKNKKILALVLAVIAVPKIIHEYFQHYLLIQPWQWQNFGSMMGLTGFAKEYMNYFIWGGILYILPLGALLYYLIRSGNTTRN